MSWDCTQYYSYLFDRTPHWEDDILRDWFPTDDAWIGQVMTAPWAAFTGTQHVRDRLHMGAPDLSGGWDLFDTQSMLTNNGLGEAESDAGCTAACSRTEVCVGWGVTRKTFDRYKKSYTTRPFCFDEINTRAKAREQMGDIVAGLKEITKMVQADFLRSAALYFANTIYICGSALTEVTITAATFSNTACATMDIGGAANLPTSELTAQYLQRFYEPLQFEGYFKSKYVPNGIFKLITDPITSQQLTTGNPAFTSMYRLTDFTAGGNLFKYGMSAGIGNYGIAWDAFPMRFYWDAGAAIMRRVWPFVNIAAGAAGGPSMGIKKSVNTQYLLAPYQVSQVWHPEAMKRYVPNLQSVNPEMPFLTRDLAGKWQFVGGNRDRVLVYLDPTDGVTTCTVDNKRGNQGLMFADFEGGIEFQRPELVRGILHLREPGCVTNQTPCSEAPDYEIQDYSGCLPLCQEEEAI